MASSGNSLPCALTATRAGTIFTTHSPGRRRLWTTHCGKSRWLGDLKVSEAGFVLAAILIMAGFTWLIHSYQTHQHQLVDWLKPVLLLITGGIMIALPNAGIAAIGLMFILYFVLDAYRNFTESNTHAGHGRGWFWRTNDDHDSTTFCQP
ncbi:hypothetical protein [Acidithiobacillus sp.]|uniref:hypothetical protein n=1 Tax=Acidithiobacillus sp. TaxID=1872118 RepID=UPI0025B98866|nr:hypothetical protein [Acidithiobacillus sp.]